MICVYLRFVLLLYIFLERVMFIVIDDLFYKLIFNVLKKLILFKKLF